MVSTARSGVVDAEIVLFNKGGRDSRLEKLTRGEAVPREFFYGFFDIEEAGFLAAMMSSSGSVPGFRGAVANIVERTFARIARIGVRPFSAGLTLNRLTGARVAISFTDGFSLSIGCAFGRPRRDLILIGGFQGLCDIEGRAPRPLRGLVRRIIARSVAGLDHVFFLGPADRARAIERYGVRPEHSSILTFGVDTEYWQPVAAEPDAEFVLAIGQDLNRDFDLLAAAPGKHPTLIITRNAVRVPPGADHVRVSPGGYSNPKSVTDEELRQLYSSARAVVVPLKDVYQPSGQSVTLQAMSCGRPVILTKTRGIWAPELLKDGENCILIPPGNAVALGAAITRLRNDPALAARIGKSARATAVAHFGLDQIGRDAVELARLGLSLAAKRSKASAG